MQVPDNIITIALNEQYFDIAGLSAYCAMGESTIRYHIKFSGLPCFKIPGRNGRVGKILVRRSEFDAWMERYRDNQSLDIDGVVADVLESLGA